MQTFVCMVTSLVFGRDKRSEGSHRFIVAYAHFPLESAGEPQARPRRSRMTRKSYPSFARKWSQVRLKRPGFQSFSRQSAISSSVNAYGLPICKAMYCR